MKNADNSHSIHYADLLKNWPKGIGPKPTNEQFAVAHACGKRLTGSKHAVAIACMLRPLGATEYEHRVAAAAFDHVELRQQTCLFNYARRNIEAGFLTRNMTAGSRLNPQSGRGEAVWALTLSATGTADMGRLLPALTETAELKAAPIRAKAKAAQLAARQAAKAKAAATRKARKALPAPPAADVVDVAPVQPVAGEPVTTVEPVVS